jgi:hypothetical protein
MWETVAQTTKATAMNLPFAVGKNYERKTQGCAVALRELIAKGVRTL